MIVLGRILGETVDPTLQEVVKFLPSNPPRRYERILVDGVPHRVTRVRVKWDGLQWTLLKLRAKAIARGGDASQQERR